MEAISVLVGEERDGDLLGAGFELAEIHKPYHCLDVYLGNVPRHRGENTYCHRCGELLIERCIFDIIKDRVVGNRCPQCDAIIPGRFGRKG